MKKKNESTEVNTSVPEPVEKKTHKATRIGEIHELRGTNSKVFRMSDGTEQAVFYPRTIHSFNEGHGEFDEVDTSLTPEEDGKYFCNTKNGFAAKFSCEEDNDELFSIENGSHRVTAFVKKNKKHFKRRSPTLRKKTIKELETDALVFENAEAGTDIEYSVTANGVKENIIVKEKADIYRFPFILHCENVEVEFDENSKRVSFKDKKNGMEVFFIPAPFMYDAKDEISNAVFYEVEKEESGKITFTITADNEWINAEERVFPVTIDPQIMVPDDSGSITTYGWRNQTITDDSNPCVGAVVYSSGLAEINRMYMNLTIPTLPRNPRIKNAELKLYQSSSTVNSASSPKIGLYQVNETIAVGSSTPDMEAYPIDFDCIKVAPTGSTDKIYYTFDITKLIDAAYNGEINFANLALKLIDENTSTMNYIFFHGSNDPSYAPEICITYESSYGVNNAYRTHTHTLGRFGQGNVDLQCGNLMFECQDFAWGGNRMPVTIKHLYNSALANYQYTVNDSIGLKTADFSAMKLGFGWKLNIMQSMTPATFLHEGTNYIGYVYINESGEEIYFKQSENTGCDIESNVCYDLFENVEDSETLYDPCNKTLVQGDKTYLFDESGRLISITDSYGNVMSITYTADKITAVTDGAGRVFEFSYNVNNFLTAVTAPDGTSITYSYLNNTINKITYPSGEKAVIMYSGNIPTAVAMYDNTNSMVYRNNFEFSGNRIIKVTEYGVENGVTILGMNYEYNYSAATHRTVVTTTEPIDSDAGETVNNVLKTVYSFNDNGEIIDEYMYSTDTGNVGVGVTPVSAGTMAVVNNINNLLVDHSFDSLEHWSRMSGNCYDIDIKKYSYAPYAKYGNNLLRIQSNNDDAYQNGVYQVTNTIPAGEYTFSAYIRVTSKFTGDPDIVPGAYIRVTTTAGTVLAESEHLGTYDKEYIRLIAPFRISSERSVKVQILVNGKGTIHVDAAQLENNTFANSYNSLENGNFEHSLNNWNIENTGIACDSATYFNMGHSLKMVGDPEAKKRVYQNIVTKSARNTRETFTLSGWAKGYGIVERERDGIDEDKKPTFRLRAEVKYADPLYKETGTEEFIAEFSPYTEEWQLASVRFAKTKFRTIEYIRVYCEYDYNFGEVYFDDIQLIRNSLESDLDESAFTGYSINEIYTTAPCDSMEEITSYQFKEKEDVYGNPITETSFKDGEFGSIYSSFCYSENGNDLIHETDSRGNKTEYIVNSETSRKKIKTDRCGNKTEYEFDSACRTNKITNKKSDDIEISNVSYTYGYNNNFTEITRGDGIRYILSYSTFNDLKSIRIEGKTENLIEYTYKGSNRLKQIKYANDDTMKATYNSIGQLVSEKWYDSENTLIAHYKYAYDGQGNIVRSIDFCALKEYNYIYEDGRLFRGVEYNITVDTHERVVDKKYINSVMYSYDLNGNATKKRILYADGTEQTINYEKIENVNTIINQTINGRTLTSHSKNDNFGRKVFDEIQFETGSISRQFSYHTGKITEEHKNFAKVKSSPTTSLVNRISFTSGRTLDYEYDAEERIVKVIDSLEGTTEYTYDAFGQLLTETVNNVIVNTMIYDNYGNILTKNGKNYTYGDAVWKDKLTEYDNQSILYDTQGNPTNYRGHTLEWEKGRQLKSIGNGNIEYFYNANNSRTGKNIGGIPVTYTLEGTKILREVWGNDIIVPIYDNKNSPCGIIFNDVPYYFVKNLQNDIIAIVDQSGTVVVRYSYDAWGVCNTTQDTSGCNLSTFNPFRYRGYYFDEETGWYYLHSRYYDPETGRFISADEPYILFLTEKNVLGTNLSAYCYNNPINLSDSAGCQPQWAQVISKHAKDTPAYKLFTYATQQGWYPGLFWAAGFFRTLDDGIYHTFPDCWQQYFGYNDVYDWAFDLGTKMAKNRFEFNYCNKMYAFWVWKGDYLNLGAGAELGFYSQLIINGKSTGHWLAETESPLSMSMTLKKKEKVLANYHPLEKQWWITCFNPFEQDAIPEELSVTFRISFGAKKSLFSSFYNKIINSNDRHLWRFDTDNRTAVLTF